MSASTISIQPSHPTVLDDELAALALQLEEIEIFSQSSKGKHPVNQPPDVEVAFASFQAELAEHKTFLADRKLAESIGAAVHSDGLLIGELTSQEVQFYEDRRHVLRISNEDPEIEAPPSAVRQALSHDVHDWMSTLSATVAQTTVLDFSDNEDNAGPSMSFAERQAETIKKLSMEFQCAFCLDRFPRALMVSLKCSHRYCGDCAKGLFIRATRDEDLYPPRCCKQCVPLQLVAKHMQADELATFELASIEYTMRNRTYCSNLECNTFIHPDNIEPHTGRATCSKCATATCSGCNNAYHPENACPEDEGLRETQALAQSMGWRSCNNCDRVIQLRTGCNHITCKCSAEFCYVCGIEWKNCRCDVADLHRIEERAEEVVNRDAPPDLPQAVWQQRVDDVFNELRDRHECEHSRRFERKTHGQPKKGFRCELCSNRHWKYILQCHLCYLNVCEDCRRNRI
ncbi:uncharacterized protein M421DRAFT_58856 [Didymella exigua CBS 183.55]|uniref:RBR-type E3 ubiquitin transferase n=1 Tax=Didymella exigua CBS 183.55 TaxID=1150837 RepID=A0A6A5RRW8_9PLEO|nr:uncharacterized protein M421DRAFT_58856 [Didymella exigua CBS 183.55]KAF1930369.1 hypothetical protein M421DRAFT_58856 [Didymella exigua CBS 183.55]